MVFFFNDTATTEIYTLSLHDALPIYVQITGPATVWVRHAFGSKLEDFSRRRAGRNSQFLQASERGDFDRRSQCRLAIRYWEPQDEVCSVAFEDLVLPDGYETITVARRTTIRTGLALTRQADSHSIFDPGGNRHIQIDRLRHEAASPATFAGV